MNVRTKYIYLFYVLERNILQYSEDFHFTDHESHDTFVFYDHKEEMSKFLSHTLHIGTYTSTWHIHFIF